MSNPAKPRGLADLDALLPNPAAAMPKAPAVRTVPVPVAKDKETPAQMKPRPVSRTVVARRERVRTRSQVFYLPDDQIDALGRLSRSTELSKSELVRQAISDFLERQ